jgi:hypothetical protein
MFQVAWRKSALDEVAALWINADSTFRESITAATAKIDFQLSHAPLEVGESRPNNQRIAFVPPLAFRFKVEPADQRVVIIRVWAPGRKD